MLCGLQTDSEAREEKYCVVCRQIDGETREEECCVVCRQRDSRRRRNAV